MSRVRLRNSLLVAIIGFLLGWVITRPIFVAWTDSYKIRASSPTSLTPTQPISYSSYVILWVDDWAKVRPLVEAVWIASLPLDYASVDLTALPPEPFRESLSRAAQGLPPEMIQAHIKGSFGGTVVFDRKDIRGVIDLFGGIDLGGQRLTSAAVEQYLDGSSNGAPVDKLIRQAAVMQSLLAQLAIGGAEIRLADLIDIPKSSADRGLLIEVVRHYYPLHMQSVHVRVETPETAEDPP